VSRILVTGGAGFIGRHLVRALVARGDQLAVAGRRPATALPPGALPEGVRYESIDLSVPGAAASLLGRLRPEIVFHLASAVDVRRDLDAVDEQVRSTQMAAVHVARGCLENGVARLVHVGTCEEYGNGPAPFHESQDPSPVSPYSAAKVAATAFVRMLATSFGLPAVVVRPFLTYGPGQGTNQMIPALISSALDGRDFPMTGGEQTREFNFVDDIVAGLLLAMAAPGAVGQIVNLGCGEPRRIRDVAARVLELMGDPVRAEFGKLPYRPGETWQFYCSNERARALLGWSPRVPLDEGLRRTIAWYRDQRAGARP
jgi:nucleoside-diphosphate-sugar epimerase